MPPTILGTALSILLGMSLVVGAWGGYWVSASRRSRGIVMIAIGAALLVGSAIGLVWLRAPFILQAALVTLVVGAVATVAEVWVRRQRAPSPLLSGVEVGGEPADSSPQVDSQRVSPTAAEPAPVVRRAAVRHPPRRRGTQPRQAAGDGRARSRPRP